MSAEFDRAFPAILQRHNYKSATMNEQLPENGQSIVKAFRPQLTRADGWIAAGFAFFSWVYFLALWKGAYPYLFLAGDAANIASFVAGWEHPTLFRDDPFLGNPDNFRFYATIHIPLTQLLAKITGDYGSAYIYMLGPHVLVQMLGFYVLGLVVYQNRYWATLLAITTTITVPLPLGEYWGIYINPQPRFSFQALLPFLLAAAFYYKNQVKAWPWLMAGAGSLIYFHPVSAPGWGLAIWLGFWVYKPTAWSFGKQLRHTLLSSVTFFALTVPWVIYYSMNHAHGKSADYETVLALMKEQYNPAYLNVGLAIKAFMELFGGNRAVSLVALLFVLSFVWLVLNRPQRWDGFKLIVVWLLGILFSAIGITFVEQSVERTLKMLPLQLDLIRGLRYVLPLVLLMCFWCLNEVSKNREGNREQIRKRKTQRVAIGVGAFFTLVYCGNNLFFWRPVAGVVWHWTQGHLTHKPQTWREITHSLQVIKHQTPPQAGIFPFGRLAQRQALSIRYYALRPVVFVLKDKSALGYANHKAFLAWDGKYQKVKSIESEQNPERQAVLFLRFYRSLKAHYCLMDSNLSLAKNLAANTQKVKVIHQNPTLTLFQIDLR